MIKMMMMMRMMMMMMVVMTTMMVVMMMVIMMMVMMNVKRLADKKGQLRSKQRDEPLRGKLAVEKKFEKKFVKSLAFEKK